MPEDGQPVELPELSEETLGEQNPEAGSPATPEAGAPSHEPRSLTQELGFVMDVPLRLSVKIGGSEMLVREVLQLNKGSVVELDRLDGEPADVFINDRLVAKGEVTVVEERLAVRILEVLASDTAATGG